MPPRHPKMDRKLIALKQRHEVRYWTKRLGVTAERLRAAVKEFGHSVVTIRYALQKDPWARGEKLEE